MFLFVGNKYYYKIPEDQLFMTVFSDYIHIYIHANAVKNNGY